MSDEAPKLKYPIITEAEFWTAPLGLYHIADANGQPIIERRLNEPVFRMGTVREVPRDFMDESQMRLCSDGLERGISDAYIRFYYTAEERAEILKGDQG